MQTYIIDTIELNDIPTMDKTDFSKIVNYLYTHFPLQDSETKLTDHRIIIS